MTSMKNGMSSELLSVFWQELLLVGTYLLNVQVLCVCGGLVALTVSIAPKFNRITAVDFSTSAAITQKHVSWAAFLSRYNSLGGV